MPLHVLAISDILSVKEKGMKRAVERIVCSVIGLSAARSFAREATYDTVYYVDQIVTVRKTPNSEK